jgi:hypothetical protein
MGTGISNEKLIEKNNSKAVDNYYGSEAIEEKRLLVVSEIGTDGIRYVDRTIICYSCRWILFVV